MSVGKWGLFVLKDKQLKDFILAGFIS